MRKKDEPPSKVDFMNRLKAALDLKPEYRLYSVMAMLKENLRYHFFRSQEIFEYAYDDPKGADYWRTWFDKPSITVETFARLLSTQIAAEYADNLSTEQPNPTGVYSASRKKIILMLQEAADMGCLKFKGELDALLGMRDGNEVLLGVVWITNSQGLSQPKTLDQVKVYPRRTIEWFADSPERVELLPKSLRSWWETQPITGNLPEIKKSDEELLTQTKPVYDPHKPHFDDNGDYWQVSFQGKTISLGKTKGLIMIKFLVDRSDEIFTPRQLLQLISNPLEVSFKNPDNGYEEIIASQSICDATTISAVKNRLAELRRDPLPDLEENMEEIEKCEQYLHDARSLKGKVRNFHDDNERIRSSVDKAIRRTIKNIKKISPGLHQHLTQTILAKNFPRWAYFSNRITK